MCLCTDVALNRALSACTALASDTEYRVREIIQEAMKFMKHSKRDKLTPGDINAALRLRHVEQLYGYGGGEPVRFQRALDAKGVFFVHDDELPLADLVTRPVSTQRERRGAAAAAAAVLVAALGAERRVTHGTSLADTHALLYCSFPPRRAPWR